MAHADINPFFLSWQQRGVEFLLSQETVSPERSLCHAKEHKAVQRKRVQYTSEERQRGAVASGQSAQRMQSAQPQAAQRTGARSSYAKPQRPAPAQSVWQDPHGNKIQKVTEDACGCLAQVTSLPTAWQERLEKTRPTPVLFSYWALGYDLYGQADVNRRELLKKMIMQDLKQTGNAYSFWPVALPEENTLVANPAAFWAGLKHLQTRGLVLFGSKAAQAVGMANTVLAGTRSVHNNCHVLVVQDIDYVMQQPRYYQQMMSFLTSFLGQFSHIA